MHTFVTFYSPGVVEVVVAEGPAAGESRDATRRTLKATVMNKSDSRFLICWAGVHYSPLLASGCSRCIHMFSETIFESYLTSHRRTGLILFTPCLSFSGTSVAFATNDKFIILIGRTRLFLPACLVELQTVISGIGGRC